jgi:lipid-A-disaccharide synthase
MVIVYRLSPLSYRVGRLLIRVEHVGMANLLAGERLFPELIQGDFTPERLASEALGWMEDRERLAALGPGLARIVRSLEGLDASQRAAQVALELMAGGGKNRKKLGNYILDSLNHPL